MYEHFTENHSGRDEGSFETLSRVSLCDLNKGDMMVVCTGNESRPWVYSFRVNQPAEGPRGFPVGTLVATSPDGDESAPATFSLRGAGSWTTRQENPVQVQLLGFTPSFESVYIGGVLFGTLEGCDDLVILARNDEEITEIKLARAQ